MLAGALIFHEVSGVQYLEVLSSVTVVPLSLLSLLLLKESPLNSDTQLALLCGRGQRAVQNWYIFHPDDAREERKVRQYPVV